jgi:glutamate dehydrogenase (NADP+)
VLTVSDSSGTVYDQDGFTPEKLEILREVKNVQYGRVSDYATRIKARFLPATRPWHIPMDVALPCATQNELDAQDAATLISNGVVCVVEGANMPTTLEAVHLFQGSKVLYAPGKASNAGGVATSGLEMSQNSLRLNWTRAEVDERLHRIMNGIHESCMRHGQRDDGSISYVDGANIAGFVKVADAMRAQGVI